MTARKKYSIDEIRLSDGTLFTYSPRYVDPQERIIKAFVRFPDGTIKEMEAPKDSNSPLIRDVFLQYSEEEIQAFTKKERMFLEKKRELQQRLQDDREREDRLKILGQSKAEALQIDIIKQDSNRKLRKKIRRAKSVFEVNALVTSAFLKKDTL